MVGDGNFVGIEPQIFKDLLRASKGLFAIDYPFVAIQLPDETLKGRWCVQVLCACTETEHVLGKGMFEIFDELASKDLGKGAHRDEKIVS